MPTKKPRGRALTRVKKSRMAHARPAWHRESQQKSQALPHVNDTSLRKAGVRDLSMELLCTAIL